MEYSTILVTKSSMPDFDEYIAAIRPLWDSHWITNMGAYHKEFELKLKEYLHVPEVSLMVNGHMALEMAIQAFNFPQGAEIITTPFTFISTTHAIVRNGLVPVFCDVKKEDGTIDEKKIEELITEKTVAIVPVHVYGNVCKVEEIEKIAKKHGLKVIYDAAHAFAEKYRGIGIGNFGDASIYSFHATKVFNSIEGGAVTFADHRLYEKLYDLKNFGIHGAEHVEAVGANAKMNEFCAIMGLCNLKHIDEYIENRRKRWVYYRKELSLIKGIRFLCQETDEIQRNYSYFPIIVEDEYGITRDELFERLKKCNIFSRKYFYPLTCDQDCYCDQGEKIYLKNHMHNVETARELSSRVLVVPFYADMEKNVQDRIIELINLNEGIKNG